MKYLILSLILILGCGKGTKGVKGQDGKDGVAITGPSGPTGKAGKDGVSNNGTNGRNGSDGSRGPQGYPGNIDNLIDGGYHCNGRFDADYGWYELNFWVYNLSTKERYMFGRSDLNRQGGLFIPDSASFFGNFIETASFVFTASDKKSNAATWRYKRTNRRGNLSCAKISTSEEK